MKMHLTTLSDTTMLLIVQFNEETIVETVHINELTQRILNYASIPSFSVAHTGDV